MSKPFNFEEFKAGNPAKIHDTIIHFLAYDEELEFPVVVRIGTNTDAWKLNYLKENATMLTTKRTVWIAICKHSEYGIEPDEAFYNSKEEAMNNRHEGLWQVIDAIPYEIEE